MTRLADLAEFVLNQRSQGPWPPTPRNPSGMAICSR